MIRSNKLQNEFSFILKNQGNNESYFTTGKKSFLEDEDGKTDIRGTQNVIFLWMANKTSRLKLNVVDENVQWVFVLRKMQH